MIRFLRRLIGLPGFFLVFLRSPEWKKFRKGEMGFDEACYAFTDREDAEHARWMEKTERQIWRDKTRGDLAARKCERVQKEIDAACRELEALQKEREALEKEREALQKERDGFKDPS